MYHGEVNVAQEELDSFLSVAEDLKVKGLTQGKTKSTTNERVPPALAQFSSRITQPPPQHHKHQASSSNAPSNSNYSSKRVFQAEDDVQEVTPPIKNEPGTLVTQEEEQPVYTEDESTE